MSQRFWNRPVLLVFLGLGLGLLVGIGMMIGTWTALHSSQRAEVMIPPALLHATATHSGESMAIATGPIDEDVEGLFILDYLTGDLQCFVLNPRTYAWGGIFRYNVTQDLGVETGKRPNFAMVTGATNFLRGSAARGVPALSVVYVMDANTGNFAAYGIQWDRTAARAGTPQKGTLTRVAVGRGRALEIRD